MEIKKLIKTQYPTMSKYQIDNFVINDKMTDYKILKQVLLELSTRYDSMEELELDIEEEKLILQKLEDNFKLFDNISDDNIDKKLEYNKIKKQKLKVQRLLTTKKNQQHEIDILEKNFNRVTQGKDPQKILENPNGEEEYWTNKFIKEAQIDIMTTGRIGKGLLDAIMMMDDKIQQKIITNAIKYATESNHYLEAVEQITINSLKPSPELALNSLELSTKQLDNLE